MDDVQLTVMTLLEQLGLLNIQQIKEETGYLVKVITPALYRLQEAFLVYEDQYDGEWDRAWYQFGEMFPDCNLERHTRAEALDIVLQRFAYRMVWFDAKMAKAFYRLPEKEIKQSCARLVEQGVLAELDGGYMLAGDMQHIDLAKETPFSFVRAFHRNDFLVRACDQETEGSFQAAL